MIVYHGSKSIVVKPDISYSRNSTDFSKGFYLTEIKEQARLWSLKTVNHKQFQRAFINEYELNEKELIKLKVKTFNKYNNEWLEFITNCRLEKDNSEYDVVIGPVADDRVYDSIKLYLNGLITAKESINKIKMFTPNMQICIRNNEAIDKLLLFKSVEAVYGK